MGLSPPCRVESGKRPAGVAEANFFLEPGAGSEHQTVAVGRYVTRPILKWDIGCSNEVSSTFSMRRVAKRSPTSHQIYAGPR